MSVKNLKFKTLVYEVTDNRRLPPEERLGIVGRLVRAAGAVVLETIGRVGLRVELADVPDDTEEDMHNYPLQDRGLDGVDIITPDGTVSLSPLTRERVDRSVRPVWPYLEPLVTDAEAQAYFLRELEWM
jgi:hypothetical protein